MTLKEVMDILRQEIVNYCTTIIEGYKNNSHSNDSVRFEAGRYNAFAHMLTKINETEKDIISKFTASTSLTDDTETSTDENDSSPKVATVSLGDNEGNS